MWYKRSGWRYKGKIPLQPGMAVADRKVKKSPVRCCNRTEGKG
ncbi:hypothetical protein [Butyricimonas virosa]|nr:MULTISPECIES: hypothetical protein [Odoribacteraceae]